jgi:PhnB protein
MAVTLDAYLFFPGNTEQAISFYQEVFGGQTTITRRGDVDQTASETEKDQVVNALLTGGDVTLRASDRDDTTLDVQTRVELSVIGTDEARLRRLPTLPLGCVPGACPDAGQRPPSGSARDG